MIRVGQARGISVLRTRPRLRLECENGTMTKLVDSCGQCLGAATSARADAETATRSTAEPRKQFLAVRECVGSEDLGCCRQGLIKAVS